MSGTDRRCTWSCVLVAVLACGSVTFGQEGASAQTQPATPAPEPATPTAPQAEAPPPKTAPGAAAAPKKAGPKFTRLRYDEDFSYLEGPPDSYKPDFFDPIKWIKLSDDLRLSIGGEFRARVEWETNRDLGTTERTQDTFLLHRYHVHFDLRYRKTARLFVQGITAFSEDRVLFPRSSDEDHWDLGQLFVDVRPFGDNTPLTLRVGREELRYGVGRLVNATTWSNVRQRFDGVKLIYEIPKLRFDLFYHKPVVVERVASDHWNEEFDFYGVYLTYTGIPRHGLDVYFFAVDDTGNRRNPNGFAGDVSRYTLGARFWGKTGGFDYETELFGQWGTWAGDTIQAWNWSIVGGYTFENVAMQPRIGAGFDAVTGDDDPNDRAVGTVDHMFGSNHSYFGYLDIIERPNLTAANVSLSAWPVKEKVRTAATYWALWLSEAEDAAYDGSIRPVRRDPTGLSGREIGHELDVTIEWNIDVHSSLLLGWSHFWSSDFIINTGRDEDADFYYIQYAFRF